MALTLPDDAQGGAESTEDWGHLSKVLPDLPVLHEEASSSQMSLPHGAPEPISIEWESRPALATGFGANIPWILEESLHGGTELDLPDLPMPKELAQVPKLLDTPTNSSHASMPLVAEAQPLSADNASTMIDLRALMPGMAMTRPPLLTGVPRKYAYKNAKKGGGDIPADPMKGILEQAGLEIPLPHSNHQKVTSHMLKEAEQVHGKLMAIDQKKITGVAIYQAMGGFEKLKVSEATFKKYFTGNGVTNVGKRLLAAAAPEAPSQKRQRHKPA